MSNFERLPLKLYLGYVVDKGRERWRWLWTWIDVDGAAVEISFNVQHFLLYFLSRAEGAGRTVAFPLGEEESPNTKGQRAG